MDARSTATKILTEVIKNRRSLSDCLDHHIKKLDDARERALAKALCYGVLRWQLRLQAVLQRLVRKPIKPDDTDIQVLLLIGLYQHIYLRIPSHAATAATVNVARELKKPWATGLVNAVLRNFQRQREQLLNRVDAKIHVKFAHPSWLLKRLQTEWPQQWEAIAEANNTHPPFTLRVNARQSSRDDYLELLHQADMAAIPTPYTDYGITLEQPIDVQQLPNFRQGWVSIQDGAAQLAAPLLNVPVGAQVLDACAAPGGKTAHLLERYQKSTLLALDNQLARLKKLNDTLQRLQITTDWCCADVTQPNSWWDGQPFDRILLDAPCSSTGVIRRHPDIKYLRQPSDIDALAAQQARLLEALWPLLIPGGQLLYVTCSIIADENDRQIQRFLATHTDASEIVLTADWGHACQYGRQILPGENNMDGFYYACLSKKSYS
jgi:16S rRNA (cytosine967-C5)-methyltransferase